MFAFRSFALAGISLALAACSSAASSDQTGLQDRDHVACTLGQSRCEAAGVVTCEADASGHGTFGAPTPCEGGAVCKEGACQEPSPKQRAQAAELAEMMTTLRRKTAWHSPLDWDELIQTGARTIYQGDGESLKYASALFTAFMAVPQGHQSIYFGSTCGTLVPISMYARRGVCGRPHPDGIVITTASAGNALGLSVGDLVTGLGDKRAADVIAELASRPMCAVSRPSASFRDTSTAGTFADLVREGETLVVRDSAGAERSISVPELSASSQSTAIDCSDPLGRPRVPIEAKLRSDGVAVMRLGGFTDPEQTFPTSNNPADFDQYRQIFEDKIFAAFDTVKSAPKMVWDIRGNGGGLTSIGLAIASGFQGAKPGLISYCEARIAGTDSPEFSPSRYAEYKLSPGGRFAYAGRVAILMDGSDYSAADYFPFAAKIHTDAVLVGKPTAGGFGATSGTDQYAGPPQFSVSFDLNRCTDAEAAKPLEGESVVPHVDADYDPRDLLIGRDTMLEKAVEALAP